MSNEEHLFENLIYHDKDIPGEPNAKGLSQEVLDTVKTCYYYVVYNLFGSRERLDDFLLEEHDHNRIEKTNW